MTHLAVGHPAPLFKLPDDTGKITNLADFKGQHLVVYFYPKDDTPGCTVEACDFRDNFMALNRLKVAVVGVSKDSVASHQKFKEKYNLNFPLLSDEGGTMAEDYGVWIEKSMYGKTYMGIERSTFLIGPDGVIKAIWPKVKVEGHVDEVRKMIG
jgi:peroxiredoxin Q/BCP